MTAGFMNLRAKSCVSAHSVISESVAWVYFHRLFARQNCCQCQVLFCWGDLSAYDLPCRRFLASVTELRFSHLFRFSRLYSSSVTVRPCEDTGVNRPGRCLDVLEVLTRVLVAATHIGVIRPAHSRPSHRTATVIVQLVGHAHRSPRPTFPSDLIVRWLDPDISLRGSVWAWLAGDNTCVYAYI